MRVPLVPFVAALVVVIRFAGVAGAQSTAPAIQQEVIVTGTITEAPAALFGRTVATLEREALLRLGIRSAIDALRLVPGVDVRARGPRDVQSDFSMRGATFGQQLILIDGLRLNNSQTGHHNGDIPVPLIAVERIEVQAGGSSSAYGSDALGGVINFITRRDQGAAVTASAGDHGLADLQASFAGGPLPRGWRATGWASRSGGFTFDRDFAMGGASVRGAVRPGWTVDVRHQRKAFGANGFYGPSPSKEWTDQTIVATTGTFVRRGWTTQLQAAGRRHGDHFRWDIARPGVAENEHRTSAVEANATTSRVVATSVRLALGLSGGGDWIGSNNLGDRDFGRAGGFAEAQWTPAARLALQAGVRVDAYSTFGHTTNPTVSASWRVTDAVTVRSSVARAFRIPTYTERFYSDPSNLGTADLQAERGWSYDAGVDVTAHDWRLRATAFRRDDEDVIDWVRATPAERWRSANVRDVRSTGLELTATRQWRAALVRASYTRLDVAAPTLQLLSRYLLEFAPHSYGLSGAVPLGRRLSWAVNADRRHRIDGQRYTLVGTRLTARAGVLDVFVDATNLLDRRYVEVPGVAMPGRWLTAGLTWTRK